MDFIPALTKQKRLNTATVISTLSLSRKVLHTHRVYTRSSRSGYTLL